MNGLDSGRAAVTIIGAGPAGWAAAQMLARAGKSVTLYSGEAHHPYNRVEVTKSLLAGTATVEECGLGSVPEGVRLITDTPVRVDGGHLVDPAGNVIDGPVILATGARARGLPGQSGAHALRTADDVDGLKRELGTGPRRVHVIGAGVLGLEAASSLAAAGHRVSVADIADRVMTRMAPPEASRWIQGIHERAGIEFLLSGGAPSDEPEVTLISVGIVPETELAAGLGAAVGIGVIIDDRGRTTVPGLYAAGDCTELTLPDGSTRRDEHLAEARASGQRAAAGVLEDLGEEPVLRQSAGPQRRWSVQAGVRLTAIGDIHGDELVLKNDGQVFESVVVRGERVVGAFGGGQAADLRALGRLVTDGGPIPAV